MRRELDGGGQWVQECGRSARVIERGLSGGMNSVKMNESFVHWR